MPNQNGRGPENEGPKTGRGLGTCDGVENNTNNNNGRGVRMGRGRGGRRGGGQGRNFVNQEK